MTDLKDLSEEKRGKIVKNLKEEIENEKKCIGCGSRKFQK